MSGIHIVPNSTPSPFSRASKFSTKTIYIQVENERRGWGWNILQEFLDLEEAFIASVHIPLAWARSTVSPGFECSWDSHGLCTRGRGMAWVGVFPLSATVWNAALLSAVSPRSWVDSLILTYKLNICDKTDRNKGSLNSRLFISISTSHKTEIEFFRIWSQNWFRTFIKPPPTVIK